MATDQRGPFTIPSGKMLLRTLAYVWPASRPAAGVLADDGAGNLSLTPYGTPGNSAVGDSAAAGSATAVAHSDHVHGRETFATPTVTFTNVNSVGSSGHPLQSDCSFAVFDTTNPEDETFGALASPSVGGANTVARRDHRHAMPAPAFATSAPSAVAQSSGVTFTTTRARLFTIGKFVIYVCQVTITQAGTSGQPIAVTLPFTWAANAGQAYGTFRYDRSTGASHFGNASQAASTNQVAFAVPTLGFLGTNPAFATANGDVLWFTVSGETT